jgi:hypothetical protein
MTAPRPLSLSLEFQADGEGIAGCLSDRNGNHWDFSSWLGLLTLIERVLAGTSSTNYPRQREVS